ncbi:MAG: response regulator [Bacteroidetes bacterium]|nr:response regulator [Bacteroidota bacterium]
MDLSFCRIIKRDDRMADVPVIFLTAKSQTEDLEAGFAAGGVDYVTKPFRREELLLRIKNHLELAASRKWIIEMNKSRDKLYSIIAHDIRSPLASISMAVKSIADGYLKPDTAEYNEIIDYLSQTTDLTFSMLNNLLSYTHNNGSSSELYPARMNLCSVVLDCVNL